MRLASAISSAAVEQRHAPDLAQIGAHRVVRAVAHVDVDRRGPLDLGLILILVVLDGDDLEAVRVARGSVVVVAVVGQQAEQLRPGELVIVIRIVACQRIRHQVPVVRGA